jgi:hypothetical protein
VTDWANDQIEELLDRTANGEPLTKVCRDPRMPCRASVYEWIDPDHSRFDADFAGRFHSARARGVHALAEECLEIADEPSRDAVAATDKRIRIDTRLRLAGKWLPKAYGEKLDLTSSDGSMKPPTTIRIVAADDRSDG